MAISFSEICPTEESTQRPPWDKNGQQGQKNSTNGPRDEKKLNAMSKKVNAMTKMSTR